MSDGHASSFLYGPARHLLDPSNREEGMKAALSEIYVDAGKLSYRLWTQRTTIKIWTLKDMGPRGFDADNQYLKPHPSVKYDEHDDQLKGKLITLIVHPLVEAFGKDDGKDYNYDKSRIWASAEVWLNSK